MPDEAISATDLHLPGQTGRYQGKVRDVYFLGPDRMVAVATDRISAFDVVLPRPIPHKGAMLNGIAAYFLEQTAHIVPNWVEAVPDANATIGRRAQALPIEMVVRGYLVGHAWRQYQAGHRSVCGVSIPEGLQEADRLPSPIITPTTKASEGHDADISREDILAQGLVAEGHYTQMERYALALFEAGSTMAAERGLLLADTKYEFGLWQGQVILIDEVHTPDSSRYFYADGYAERQATRERQRQLSKEFVREWLMDRGFSGQPGQLVPELDDAFTAQITARYGELYERMLGKHFAATAGSVPLPQRIEHNLLDYLS